MIDLQPAPVPQLSEEWIVSHRAALVGSLARRGRPAKWVALAGATGLAATVSTLLLVGGSESTAFAGWSAAPTAPASGQVSAANAVCHDRLAQLGGSTDKGGDPAALAPELSDVRGPFTVTVFGDSAADQALCVSAPGATALRWITHPNSSVSPGAIAVDQVSALAREGQPYTLVVGSTGAGVTGVTLSLGNGTTVTASSGNGVFVAWWPGSQSITSAGVTTSAGTTTQVLNLAGPGISSPPAIKSGPGPSGPAEPSNSDGPNTA